MPALIIFLVILLLALIFLLSAFEINIFRIMNLSIIDHNLKYDYVLRKKTLFYRYLPYQIRKKFIRRVKNFIDNHDFEGHEGLAVTDEMRILVSAAAVHLTLGLSDYEMRDFRRIFIYPDVYYSGYSKTINRGETNSHGIITLTWRFVEEGFDDQSDKKNLGYHEFAHALLLQHSGGMLNDRNFDLGYEQFCYMIREEHLAHRVEEAGFIRDYAFTNIMEFFAVSAECFLESPEVMKEKSPELFSAMMHMLRQDPIKREYGLSFIDFSFWDPE